MKEIELKNCPNCKKRIGIHDIECPYCKYIDDPKYKKHNEKLSKTKKKTKKANIYKILLLIPIVLYLVYLLFNFDFALVIIPLILLNILGFFMKKSFVFWIMIIEIILNVFKFVYSIYQDTLSKSFSDLKLEVLVLIFGILFVIVPKLVYLIKSTKKKRKVRKK